eukprot:1448500-Prymnesium_polylepis.1
MLQKAKETNGACVQVLVNGEPSHMQARTHVPAKAPAFASGCTSAFSTAVVRAWLSPRTY